MTNPTTPDQGDERRAFDLYWLARQRQRGFGAALTDAEMLSHPEDRADEFLAWQAARALPAAGVSIEEYRRVVSRCIELGEKIAALSVVQPVAQEAIPAGYALISIDALRAWGKLDEVRDACKYPLAAPQPSQGAFTKEELEVLASAVGALNFTKYRCLFDKVEALRLATPHPPVSAEAGKGEPFGYWHEGPSEDESEFFLAKDLPSNDCPRCFPLYLAPSESVAVSAAPSALPAQAVGEKADGDFARMAESAGAKMRWGDHGLPPEFPSWGSWGRFCDSVRSLAAPMPQPEPTSYRVFKDGNAWCAVGPGFVDIQQSLCAFHDESPYRALELLTEAEAEDKRRAHRRAQPQPEPTSKGEPVADEPVAEFLGRRRTPEGTTEFWGVMLCDPMQDPPKGSQLYLRPTQQALSDDTKRLDWLQSRSMGGLPRVRLLIMERGSYTHMQGDLREAIDAAILAAAGGSEK